MTSYLPGSGRGRGAGRGRGTVSGASAPWSNQPWSQKQSSVQSSTSQKNAQIPDVDEKKPVNEHLAMREKMVGMAAKYSPMMDSDDSSEEEIHDEEIISNTMKQYQDTLADGEISKENQMLMDVLQSGAITCLVCIDNVKRLDAIWSCEKCSCILHLQCIQKWAREGICRHALKHEGDLNELDPASITWQCPKCRLDYKQSKCPTRYYCFCGKVEDPPFDPWTTPHSCGQQCEKALQPECGHDCLLLCHPGPCPPCPKTIQSSCYCGRKGPLLKRCSNKKWSCGKSCDKRLSCGHHNCEEFCHDGDCPPCPHTSKQACLCGKKVAERPCAEPSWTCQQPCGKPYDCGHHLCEENCHDGECGECPRSNERHCPCGKTMSSQPCTEDVLTCPDTCNKPLGCLLHKCALRCHYGPCDTCLQVVERKCRCGKRTKTVPCSQVLACDFKCTNMRNCGRHPCKKKCCDGNCPPCEQICNRNLNCGNHKCPSPCHQGMCYPCPSSSIVKCFCGNAKITVPCGKEKTTKPPKCKNPCAIPPDCHHKARLKHKCHYARCPPCIQVCDFKYPSCSHNCTQKCHDKIFNAKAKEMDMLRNNRSKKVNEDIYFETLPCPPCKSPVIKLCYGEHDSKSFPCCKLVDYSCRDICGRQLDCTNHTCQKECHVVQGDNIMPGNAGKNCSKCDEICTKPRPSGCVHDCPMHCHPEKCPDCNVHLKLECHCRAIKMFFKCCEYNEADAQQKEAMLMCKARCPKMISCGHTCANFCHSGPCSTEEECVETKKVKCSCGRRKKEVSCAEIRNGITRLDCDERCKELKEKKQKQKLEKEEEAKAAEEKKQLEEIEKFERKKQGRKRKQRKISEMEEEKSFFQSYGKWLLVSGLILTVVITGLLIK